MSQRTFRRAAACIASALLSPIVHGQLDGVYEFDGGGDGTSWNDALNWERVTDPNGNPISGNPAAPPDAVTSADLPLLGVLIDGGMPGQTALDVNIGTLGGAGSLGMSGGGLTIRDLFVGAGGTGAMTISGGSLIAGDDITIGSGAAGTMTISAAAMASTSDDVFVNADSSLTVTGGVLDIGDRLIANDNATITVDGGTIIGNDDFQFFGDSQITIASGLMEVVDKLYFDTVSRATGGKLTINGGVVRSEEYGLDGAGLGLIEINGDGVYEVEQSELSLAEAMALIAGGVHLTSSDMAGLGARTVVVPDFFGQTNAVFTQIYVVPEPAAGLLLLLGLGGRRRRRTPVSVEPAPRRM